MDSQQLIIFLLVALAVGGGFYAVAYPLVAGGGRAEKRQKSMFEGAGKFREQASGRTEVALRRAAVADSLKELEKRQLNIKNPPLTVRLEQAGLDWPVKRFYVLSLVLGVILGFGLFIATGMPLLGLAGLFIGGLGLPRWILGYLRKKRQQAFIKEFPNAIDIIVRGVKSGLPLGDCMRIVASESQEPVRSEFRAIVDTQNVGMILSDSIERLYTRVGLPEANFFAIVIAIQSKSGGNLSEALGNLSRVLRDRQKMKGKIQAMSMEAKTSAWIIGSLPIFVGGIVSIISPDYVSALWTKPVGQMLLAFSAFWMLIGILSMRKMINFDF
ncbi:type II secretion system F family protein [Flaviflagellibacter deserti]|jgi:tight adherence protein B|uniref:Type II secretion system F family protein n=1 Tax=Flaviflagellibacter deserti TaxID=2267266 RepID=A0ABV9Z1B5_9HYPH